MVLLDDDAVDAGVQDDLDEEMWADADAAAIKRKKKSAELARYEQYQESRRNGAECERVCELACQEESNEHDAHEDNEDEDIVAEEEEEEQERATALTTAQANRRQRVTSWRRHMMEMDSDDE